MFSKDFVLFHFLRSPVLQLPFYDPLLVLFYPFEPLFVFLYVFVGIRGRTFGRSLDGDWLAAMVLRFMFCHDYGL